MACGANRRPRVLALRPTVAARRWTENAGMSEGDTRPLADCRPCAGFFDELFPPVRGVYQGGATSKLDASVHMTRLDPQASARA